MSRPKGMTKDQTRSTGVKLGRPVGKTKIREIFKQLPASQILDHKVKILELMSDGTCTTLTSAAEKLHLTPVQVHHWARNDSDFSEMVRLAREIVADRIEAEFQTHANFIPKMMLLKGYRPMFRDNAKLDLTNTKLIELLDELKKVGAGKPNETPMKKEPSVASPVLPKPREESK